MQTCQGFCGQRVCRRAACRSQQLAAVAAHISKGYFRRSETGLDVVPERLLYVAEVVGIYGVHDLNLVWLAQPRDPDVAIDARSLVAFDSPLARSMMPPIIKQIAADASKGWPQEPRWLGNLRRPPGGR